jgi:hypothetical protein
MDAKPINPLMAHFRQPAIYFNLPSQGQFWTSGLEMPESGDLPIYPMTARDEITLKTPDALLNGQGVVDVIHSCCPNITDAWQMPSIDVDATLIAIRIASYGNKMDFDSKCPHCSEENRFEADLGTLLAKVVTPDYTKKISVQNLRIKLQPQKYFSVNATNKISYQEQRVLSTLSDEALTEEVRLEEYKKHMTRLIELQTKTLSDSTEYIEIVESNTIVNDANHIYEFYQNCDAEVCKAVRIRLEEIGKEGSIPPLDTECQSCAQPYSVPLIFDYANFFAAGS